MILPTDPFFFWWLRNYFAFLIQKAFVSGLNRDAEFINRLCRFSSTFLRSAFKGEANNISKFRLRYFEVLELFPEPLS